MVGAITGLLVCQLAGELIARFLSLPIPGPVLGMVLLFLYLLVRHGGEGDAPEPLLRTAEVLLGNLGLLFIPAGVGVVIYGPLLARDWAPISVAVLAGTLLGIAFTGRIAQALLRWWG
ncbi:MAG: CidA/LrgA family protein [Acetobacteraceae bacterium]